MGNPVGFEGANHVFAAPEGMEDSCKDLPVFMDDTSVFSCWRMSEQEKARIAETGVVWLQIVGHRVTPVYVTGNTAVLFGGMPVKAEPYMPNRDERTYIERQREAIEFLFNLDLDSNEKKLLDAILKGDF
jgi:hypothetical protein